MSRDGTPHIGVIYDPVELTLYHAVKGQGAFRNGKPWKLEPFSASTEQSFTFISDRSFEQHSLFSDVLVELKNMATEMGYKGFSTILHGGAAMNACWVLEKAPACYFKFPKPEDGGGSLWDYAATACLFLEAGAVASDIYGKSLDLNRPDSTFMNHRGVLFTNNHDMAGRVMGLYTKLYIDWYCLLYATSGFVIQHKPAMRLLVRVEVFYHGIHWIVIIYFRVFCGK